MTAQRMILLAVMAVLVFAITLALAGLIRAGRHRGEMADAPDLPPAGVRIYVDPRAVDDLIADMESGFDLPCGHFERLSAYYLIPEETP